MTAVFGSLGLGFRDYRGRSARISITLTDATEAALATTAAAVASAIVACTNAVNTSETGLVVGREVTPAWGTAAAYADCGQKLTIVGLSQTGTLHRLSIPAPLLSDFLTDETTMNTADTNVSALLTALATHWVTSDEAHSLIVVVDGRFQDRRRKTKIGPWSRSATGGSLAP